MPVFESCYIAAVSEYDVIILGGGAAGLMCAIAAGNRGRRVVVLEGSNKIGKKILMSGGGRCNFTNLHCDPSRFLSRNRNFCHSALSRYTQWDFIALVEKHGIAYHEKAHGQLFCDHSSKEILAMLVAECEQAGVHVKTQCEISSVTKDKRFVVTNRHGDFGSESLVIATGGLSIPKMGASDLGYRLAGQFGLNVLETSAGLVPFTFSGAMLEMTSRLSGVSLHAEMNMSRATFGDNILFTHRGISGPASLQLSSYWCTGESISINLLPDVNAERLLLDRKESQPKAFVRTILTEQLPRALVFELQQIWWPDVADCPLAEVSDSKLRKIAENIHNWRVKPSGTEGYRTAEVTLGGIDTDELSSKTMEAKRQPGLYFIGEVVDVTGHLGGFNFQWAWASAHAAGRFV